MKRFGQQQPVVTARSSPPWAAKRMRSTLGVYYERKRNQLGREFMGYYDDSLNIVFSSEAKNKNYIKATKLLRKYRRTLVEHLAKSTGHRKFDLHKLINRIILRCDALELYGTDELRDLIGIITFLSAIASGTGRKSSQGKL